MNLTHWIPPHNINHVHHCPGLLFKFILVPRLLALVFWPIVVLTNMIGSGTVWVKRSFWVGIGHNISTYLYDIQCMLFLGICLQTSVKQMPQISHRSFTILRQTAAALIFNFIRRLDSLRAALQLW